MVPVEARLTLSPSNTVSYVKTGPEDGIPVVLLHGASDSWRSFLPLFPHVSPSLQVIAFTQRGHGDGHKPEKEYAMEDFAGDVSLVLDALHIPDAFILGHSMGSAVALRFAANHPDRVRGLFLLGAFSSFHDNDALQGLWQEVVSHLEDPVPEAFVREFQQSTLSGEVPTDFFETVVAESLKMPARVWKALFASLLAEDLRPPLAGVRAPTRIIWGDADPLCTSDEQSRLLAALPSASLTTYAGQSHAIHWEAPGRVAAELAEFIGTIAGSGSLVPSS